MSRLVNSEPREPVPVPKGGEQISASLKTPGERMSRAPSAGEASANAADGAGRGVERKGRRPHVRLSLSPVLRYRRLHHSVQTGHREVRVPRPPDS